MSAAEAPAVERLSEALFEFSGHLRQFGVLKNDAASAAYEKVVAAYESLASPAPVSEPVAGSGEAMREALILARPIVEADLEMAEGYADADWEGMTRQALEAIDAALQPSKPDAPTIPEGMVPWHGGDEAPEDWDKGSVLLRGGTGCVGLGVFRWDHQGFDDDIIAYTPVARPAATAGEVERCEHGVRHPHPCDDCLERDIPAGKSLTSHPCYGLFATAPTEFAHRAYLPAAGPIYCERCGTELDRDKKQKADAPLSWAPRPSAALASDRGEVERLRAEVERLDEMNAMLAAGACINPGQHGLFGDEHGNSVCSAHEALLIAEKERDEWNAKVEQYRIELERLREALKLARPSVEAELEEAEGYADADWEGMTRQALEAIDAALSERPAPAETDRSSPAANPNADGVGEVAAQDAGEVERLRGALEKCRDQFAFYAAEHHAKADNPATYYKDAERYREKAETNEQFANIARAALGECGK